MSIEFWLRLELQIRPTRLAIIFLFITDRAERKVCLCVKLFDFFRGWILIRLTRNLSRFVPNSVEILTWNFRKKLFRENFSKIFCKPKAIPYQNFWNTPNFLQFYSGSVLHWKNSHKYFHMLFATRTFCFRKTNIFHSRSRTYYALLLEYVGLKQLQDVRHFVYWVWAETWAPDSSYKIGNNFFINHCQGWNGGSFECETI